MLNIPVDKMTDDLLESHRVLLDSQIARIERDRKQLSREEETARRDLNEVEQEQQNRLADKSQEGRTMK